MLAATLFMADTHSTLSNCECEQNEVASNVMKSTKLGTLSTSIYNWNLFKTDSSPDIKNISGLSLITHRSNTRTHPFDFS